MSTVREILADKGRRLNSISAEATVFEAAVVMNEHRIGSLLVMEEERLIGILTERDILQRVVAEQRDVNRTSVGAVMTRDVICCRMQTELEEVRGVMRDHRVRHLPVTTEDGQVVGLISIGDLNAFQLQYHEKTINHLQEYISGTW